MGVSDALVVEAVASVVPALVEAGGIGRDGSCMPALAPQGPSDCWRQEDWVYMGLMGVK